MDSKKLEITGDEVFTLFYLFRAIIDKVDNCSSLQSQNEFHVTLSRRDVLNLINVNRKFAYSCIIL